jgi:hypothetical protein
MTFRQNRMMLGSWQKQMCWSVHLGTEVFLDDLVKNAGNANLKVIDSSKGVRTISTAAFEGKAQDRAKQVGA